MLNLDRVRLLKPGQNGTGPVVYWMSRDQRVHDHWALLYAQQEALAHQRPLVVVFCLTDHFSGAALRQYDFMLRGLEEVSRELAELRINFFLLSGNPGKEIGPFLRRVKAFSLISDFDPLRVKQRWKKAVGRDVSVPFYEVDAHNIVPCWRASSKQEFGAYTLRPKIHKVLSGYVGSFPPLKKHPHGYSRSCKEISANEILKGLNVDQTIAPVSGTVPGEQAAMRALRSFVKNRLSGYSRRRNDPVQDGQSGLSPYFHFGQLSPQRAALEVSQSSAPQNDQEAFLEELIIRRELADNFCFYNASYDSVQCVPAWAGATLARHARDRREHSYTFRQFESAQTHDDLWNAAQLEMTVCGKMHGYLRMYWAKKILEWTPSVESAWKTAVRLNDVYELDGRDPNGYAGIAWALGGVHDRAWGERNIFGKIRYMNDKGCRSKFDTAKYISTIFSMAQRG